MRYEGDLQDDSCYAVLCSAALCLLCLPYAAYVKPTPPEREGPVVSFQLPGAKLETALSKSIRGGESGVVPRYGDDTVVLHKGTMRVGQADTTEGH